MCSINHNLKAIFIHIPKNGGSYVAEILSKYYGFKNYYLQRLDHKILCGGKDESVDKHENKIHGTLFYYKTSIYLNRIMKMDEQKWNSYLIFTFIRDPYQRIVSGWNYINKYNIPFHKFINLSFKDIMDYDYWHVFMPQTRHIIDTNGKINIHFIGKLENIEDDLIIILNKIGINNIIHKSFKKNSKNHANYKKYYLDQNILDRVNKIYHEDFDNFQYKKYDDINNLISFI